MTRSGTFKIEIVVNGARILVGTRASLAAAVSAQKEEMGKQRMQWGAKGSRTGIKRSAKDARVDEKPGPKRGRAD